MSDEHVKDLLSGYLDEALSGEERGRVDAHLAACKGCREELDGLRGISKMLASLPKKDLPPGFLTRLNARRRAAESKGAPLAWLPISPKAAAFAAAALVAMVVCMNEVRYRLAPSLLGEEPEERSAAPLTEAEELDRELARRKRALDAESSWRGVLAGAEQGAGPAMSMSAARSAPSAGAARGAAAQRDTAYFAAKTDSAAEAAPEALKKEAAKDLSVPSAPLKAKLRSDGSPVGEVPGKQGPSMSSNESIYAFLQKEKSKMGIREIIPPSSQPDVQRPIEPTSPAPLSPQQEQNLGMLTQGGAGGNAAGELPDRPLSREEAMVAMRSMATGLSRMNDDYRWKTRPSVPLEATEKAKPRLLAKAQASRPIGQEPPAASAAPARADNLTAPLPSETKGLASDDGNSMDRLGMVRKPSAPKRALRIQRSWSAVQGGMGAAGGAVLRRLEDWTDMWSRTRFAPELPAVDFGKEMAVAVFGERSDEKSRSVEIVSVTEEEDRLLIRFRVKTDESASAPKPSSPLHVVLVQTSDLPFEFVQVQ